MEDEKKKYETRNMMLEHNDFDLEDIERSIQSISMDTCYDNPSVSNYIEKYKQDDFDALEDDLNQVLYEFHMKEEHHVYFVDMIRHHVHKDFDDRIIIRDNAFSKVTTYRY